MNRFARLIAITFLATAAEIVTTRAVYFFVTNRFEFNDSQNLGLALGFSTMGAIGALFSHRLAKWMGHRSSLLAAMGLNLLCDLIVVIHPVPATVVIGTLIKGACVLTMWPVVESYVTAGLTPRQTARALGWFNVAWTAAIPIMLAVSGALIDHTNMGVFLVPMVIQVAVLYLFSTLEADPVHLPDDHPDTLPESHAAHYANMLRSARFTMLSMGAGLAFINPLLPERLKQLGYTTTQATAIASATDVARVTAIILMIAIPIWHGRRSFLFLNVVAVPIGLVLVIYGGGIAPLLAGEIIFGLVSGSAYYAGIYYAMVVKRTAEGSAIHELLGQVGSLLGPGAGLVGDQFVKRLSLKFAGPLLGISPVLAALSIAALLPLRHKRPDQPAPPDA